MLIVWYLMKYLQLQSSALLHHSLSCTERSCEQDMYQDSFHCRHWGSSSREDGAACRSSDTARTFECIKRKSAVFFTEGTVMTSNHRHCLWYVRPWSIDSIPTQIGQPSWRALSTYPQIIDSFWTIADDLFWHLWSLIAFSCLMLTFSRRRIRYLQSWSAEQECSSFSPKMSTAAWWWRPCKITRQYPSLNTFPQLSSLEIMSTVARAGFSSGEDRLPH